MYLLFYRNENFFLFCIFFCLSVVVIIKFSNKTYQWHVKICFFFLLKISRFCVVLFFLSMVADDRLALTSFIKYLSDFCSWILSNQMPVLVVLFLFSSLFFVVLILWLRTFYREILCDCWKFLLEISSKNVVRDKTLFLSLLHSRNW